MSKATEETLKRAFKPFDIVTDGNGNIGLIREVNVNECQEGFDDQISYTVNWLIGDETKVAWFKHNELKSHSNILIKIAEMSCNPLGNNKYHVTKLIQNI